MTGPEHTPTTSGRAQRAVLVPFLALVVLSPLPLGGNRPLPWSVNAVAIAALLAVWAALLLRHGERAPVGALRLAIPLILTLGLIAWMTFQALADPPPGWGAPVWDETQRLLGRIGDTPISVDPTASLSELMRFLTHAGVFFLAVQLGRSREYAERIVASLAYAGLAYALYGLAMHLGGFNLILWWERWAYTDSVTSTFVNRNHFATFTGLTLLCALALLGRSFAHRGDPGTWQEFIQTLAELLERRWPLLLTTCALICALALSHSRAGLASTLAAMLILALTLFRSKQAWNSTRPLLASLAVVVAVLLLAMGGDTLSRAGDWSFQTEARDDLFRLTLRAIGDAPWLGYGGGSFAEVFRMYLDPSLPETVHWSHAHNSYLEFALEYGIPALLALLALYAWLAARCFAGLVQRRRDRLYPALGIAATLLVGLHATLDFSLQLPGVAIPYATILGVAYAQSWPSRRRS